MPYMKCGHISTGRTHDGKPVCVVCFGLTPAALDVDPAPPALIGRAAQCSCGKTVPSSTDLPFFEFKGLNSPRARDACKVCGMNIGVHQAINPTTMRAGITDHAFVPHGPYFYDAYYCGCRGWS